jgi:hypothetical protein
VKPGHVVLVNAKRHRGAANLPHACLDPNRRSDFASKRFLLRLQGISPRQFAQCTEVICLHVFLGAQAPLPESLPCPV